MNSHGRRRHAIYGLCALGALCLATGIAQLQGLAAAESLAEVKITTSASVDTTSFDTIVKDVIKPGMTDEQKATALFDWFERSMYHRGTPDDVKWNPHKVINVYGGVTCGTQGCTMAGLCRAAGFEARVTADAGGGHTYYEVKYGGGWHGFDSMNRFYVYTRGEPRQIASFEAIDKDPSIATAAAKENRTPPGYLFHGDDPAGYVSPSHQILPYTPTKIAGLEDLSLVPGQRITWYWYNLCKIHPQLKDQGYQHSCSRGADAGNPLSFPFWEPYYYLTPGCEPEQAKRRMYANGEIVFQPDLSKKDLPPGFTELSNLTGPGLMPGGNKPGTAVIQIHSPYLLVGGTLTLKPAPGAALNEIQVTVTRDGKTFVPVAGKFNAEGVLDLSAEMTAGFNYDFGVKLTLPNEKSAIADYKLNLVFMHNKYVRPFLVVGDNTVRFHAKNPERLAQSPVAVEYTWQEGPDWDKSEIKKAVQVVNNAANGEWKIKVAGTKTPRMKTLTIAAGSESSSQKK